MSCDTKICIYVLKFNSGENIYLGETTNFRLRTNLHKDHASKNIKRRKKIQLIVKIWNLILLTNIAPN